ncbi:MAG TPA: glycosyltransferase [Sporichthya sp.]|nr:glycosyltransferase [Sporichthya sp.]
MVMATHSGADTIGAAVRSLARQTLPHERFEIVVVQNGPADHTDKVLDDVSREYPDLAIRRVSCSTPGAGRARNAGMAIARGEYVTFVDDDDTVSARYLEGLLAASGPNTVAVAHLADVVDADSPPDFANRIAVQLPHAGRTLSPGDVMVVLSYNVGKLLPTEPARLIGFDPDLRSGEDIEFYLKFFLAFPFAVRLCPIEANAVYYRRIVHGSRSRQAPSYDFNVTQRLDVIERIEDLRPATKWQHRVVEYRTGSETGAINDFLRANPERHPEVLDDIRRRGLSSVAYQRLNAGVARDLAVLTPEPDEPWDRLCGLGVLVDLVQIGGPAVPAPPRELMDSVHRIAADPAPRTREELLAVCSDGMAFLTAQDAQKGRYARVYSGPGGTAQPLLAAWYKVRHPQVAWTAEFGLQPGVPRPARAPHSDLLDILADAVLGRGFVPPAHDDLHTWAVLAQCALADTIVFTDELARKRLLDAIEVPSLATRVLARSVIARDHAMLAAAYQASRPDPVRARRRTTEDTPEPVAAPSRFAGTSA